jgi:hypothetical protein
MIALSVNVLPPLHGGQRVLTARIAPEPDAVFMRCGQRSEAVNCGLQVEGRFRCQHRPMRRGSNASPSNEEFARWARAAVEG